MSGWHYAGHGHPRPAGDCPSCGTTVFKTVERSKRTVGGLVLREHMCQSCGLGLVSVQFLVTPQMLLETGISPLLFLEPMPPEPDTCVTSPTVPDVDSTSPTI